MRRLFFIFAALSVPATEAARALKAQPAALGMQSLDPCLSSQDILPNTPEFSDAIYSYKEKRYTKGFGLLPATAVACALKTEPAAHGMQSLGPCLSSQDILPNTPEFSDAIYSYRGNRYTKGFGLLPATAAVRARKADLAVLGMQSLDPGVFRQDIFMQREPLRYEGPRPAMPR